MPTSHKTSTIDRSIAIHLYTNNEYPHGYTIAKTQKEANTLAQELLSRTNCEGVCITHGGRHWKTGKYAYWTVCFDAPYTMRDGFILN